MTEFFQKLRVKSSYTNSWGSQGYAILTTTISKMAHLLYYYIKFQIITKSALPRFTVTTNYGYKLFWMLAKHSEYSFIYFVFHFRCTAFQYNDTFCQLFPVLSNTFQIIPSHNDPNVKTMIRDKLNSPWFLCALSSDLARNISLNVFLFKSFFLYWRALALCFYYSNLITCW